MPPPAQSQQGQPDNAYAPIWIMALIFIFGFAIWYSFHDYIVAFVFKIKLLEAEAVSLFTSGLNNLIVRFKTVPPGNVSFDELWAMSGQVGYYLRYPILVILGLLALILYNSDISARYRKTYTMKRLLETEYVNWPNVTPVLNLDLAKQNIDEGPWAMSLSPRVFAMKNNLIKRDLTEQKPLLRRERGYAYATINKGEAKRIFTLQLGDYWNGPEALPIHIKALFAIFAAKINRDRQTVWDRLAQFSRSSQTGKIDFTGVNELLAKYANSDDVALVCQHHAYVLTVMASMLQRARNDGVLPTAQFLWLKPIDRRLWYMLNSVGRQTPFTEVAGPFAHWLAEKELKNRCLVPMVDEAVTALDIAIREIKFKEDELPK